MSLDRNVPVDTRSLSGNRTLSNAKKAKQDEFYTQYVDIQKEVEAYLEFAPDTFRDKVVYCNCDDPFESNFFKYFASNFKKLGLKKLITTSYDGSPIAGQQALFEEYNEGNGKRKKPKALTVQLTEVKDWTGDGATGIEDVELFLKQTPHSRMPLAGGGDFRSDECIALLKQSDIVVTNPPFSLFREYVAQLVEHEKKFLIIGNKNAITYKEIFPLIKENKLWMGVTPMGTDMLFDIPKNIAAAMLNSGKRGSSYRVINGKVMGRSTSVWFTNLDHGRRHEKLKLMTMEDNRKFNAKVRKSPTCYQPYDNYDAIEVPFTDAIPSDHDGAMGVPITFLDKYNPDQFEILGATESEGRGFSNGLWGGGTAQALVNYQRVYKRIFIRHRRPAKGNKT
ncbi:MAG: adenine-specific methyltransferase EcoRI family protein [Fimbriimonadia bacterium]|nr:adenine-specific methyltransferase EcoRI family protein [Fimbriimonadia bacterium]